METGRTDSTERATQDGREPSESKPAADPARPSEPSLTPEQRCIQIEHAMHRQGARLRAFLSDESRILGAAQAEIAEMMEQRERLFAALAERDAEIAKLRSLLAPVAPPLAFARKKAKRRG